MNIEDRIYYGYTCKPCGHITLTDKKYKQKRIHCSVCADKQDMMPMGEYKIEKQPTGINLNL